MFSATKLAAIDWNEDITHDLAQKITTFDIQRSSEVTDLD